MRQRCEIQHRPSPSASVDLLAHSFICTLLFSLPNAPSRKQFTQSMAERKTVLFICTGNVCRSPMAEGLFRHLVKDRDDIEVISAGVGASRGQPVSPHTMEVVRPWVID